MYSLLDTFCHALMTPTDSVWFKCNNVRMRFYTLKRICVFRLLLFDRQAFILFLTYSRTKWNNDFFFNFISFLSSSFDCNFFLFFLELFSFLIFRINFQIKNTQTMLFSTGIYVYRCNFYLILHCMRIRFMVFIHCPTNNSWYKRHYATCALIFLQRKHCSYFSKVSIFKKYR